MKYRCISAYFYMFLRVSIIFLFVSVVFLFVSNTVSAAVINKPPSYLSLNNGIVGYWTMDGNKVNWKTGAVTDSSGRGNTGYVTNMATSTGVGIGKIGQALSFDGVDDLVTFGKTLMNGFSGFSVSFWVNPRAYAPGNYRFMTQCGNVDTNCVATNMFSIDMNSSGLVAAELSPGGVYKNTSNTDTAVSLNTWTLITLVRSGDTVTIYLNGASRVATTGFNTGTLSSNLNFLLFTKEVNSSYFNGLIDEVRIYNRALSANEITTLYNSGAAKFNVSPTKYSTSGIVGYWTMDGSKVNWKTGAVTDSSGFANTGTITNMATSTGVGIGKLGQALNFDGVDDFVSLPNLGISGGTPRTIGVWIYPTLATGIRTIVSWGVNSADAQNSLHYNVNTKDIYFGFNTDDWYTANNVALLNTWTSVIFVYDGGNTSVSTVHIYINGVAQSLTKAGALLSPNTTNSNYVIGKDPITAGREFSGLIDEVRVYNRALSADEIKKLYDTGR